MIAKLLGYLHSSFKATDGATITGVNMYFYQPITSEHGKGATAFRQFVISNRQPELTVGAEYDLQYNRNGRLESITIKK